MTAGSAYAPLSRYETKLANGLRASAVRMPHVRRSVIDIHTRIGSRFESWAHNGISHFLEHMLHRGTARFPSAHSLALAFEALGGALSAMTYVDHGALSLSAPPENLDELVAILAEVLLQPIFSGLEVEKGIVREEILESLDEAGRSVDADHLLRALAFPDHPLGFPITGSLQTLDSFDIPLLHEHHSARYIAEGSVVTVAGPIDPDAVLRHVSAVFAHLPHGKEPVSTAPAAQSGMRFSHIKYTGSQAAVRVGFRAPGEQDADEPATELLLRVLDDGMATRLYERLCDERGLCYDVSASYEAFADCGLFDIAADAAPERAEQVLQEIFAVAQALRDEGPSQSELDKAKKRFAWQLAEQDDDPAALSSFYGLGELTGVARTPAERQALLESTSRADVQRAASRLFSRDALNVLVVGPLGAKVRDRLERASRAF
ncbi:MAG: pitrilysin family protein [Polyangiaceae bacterium]